MPRALSGYKSFIERPQLFLDPSLELVDRSGDMDIQLLVALAFE